MAGIIEHGPVALGVAAQALGAGAAGTVDGVEARSEYEQGIQQIKKNRLQIEAAEMELDAEQEQMQLRDSAAGVLEKYGPGGLMAAEFHDTGETGIQGVKRAPMEMPKPLWDLYVRGDEKTKARIREDWQIAQATESAKAAMFHVEQQAQQILSAEGMYGPQQAEGDGSLNYQQTLQGAQEKTQEIMAELEAGILSPYQANEKLNELGDAVFKAGQRDIERSMVFGAFSAKIAEAYGADGVSLASPELAQYYNGWQRAFQEGKITADEALSILQLHPKQLETVLSMGAKMTSQQMPGGGRFFGTGQAPAQGAPAQGAPAPDPNTPEGYRASLPDTASVPEPDWKAPEWLSTKSKHVTVLSNAVQAMLDDNPAAAENATALLLGDDPNPRTEALMFDILEEAKAKVLESRAFKGRHKGYQRKSAKQAVKEILPGWVEKIDALMKAGSPAMEPGLEGGSVYKP